MYCVHCGKKTEEGEMFCSKCGNKINKERSEQITQSYSYGTGKVEFRTGAKVWLWICIVTNGIFVLINLNSIMNMPEWQRNQFFSDGDNLLPFIAAVIWPSIHCGLLILLLKMRIRSPLYIIIALGIFITIYNINMGIGIWQALIELGGPVITYLAIRDVWKDMPDY